MLDQGKEPDAINLLNDYVRAEDSSQNPDYEKSIWALEWIKDIQRHNHAYKEALRTYDQLRIYSLKADPNTSGERYLD
jgi:hypothetical protein